MKSFYVFGLQRSGTNYLEQLLKSNFSLSRANNSTRNDPNWKNIDRVGMSPSWKPTDADMYFSQTPKHLTPKQTKIITLTLTPTLISNLGYDII